jgi:hypothetical protein
LTGRKGEMVQEWAMVRDGQIVNIVTTGRKLSALKLGPPGVAFVPLSQVSQQMLKAYRYWD